MEEIARMLGGVEITAKAREHAREMLKTAAAAIPAVVARGCRKEELRSPQSPGGSEMHAAQPPGD